MKNKVIIKEIKNIKNKELLIHTLYKDFDYLKDDPMLGHTVEELSRLVNDEKFCSLFAFNEQNKMIGYLIGEVKQLQDSRMVYYISYLYVLPDYRGFKIGSKLIEMVIRNCENYGYKFVMLKCDTTKQKIVDLYTKFGFSKDPLLSSNDRHCVYSLFL